jgi:hypothetical protein
VHKNCPGHGRVRTQIPVLGTRHTSADGQATHLLAVCDQQAGAVVGQVSVDGTTYEVTQFAPLLLPTAAPSRTVSIRRLGVRQSGHLPLWRFPVSGRVRALDAGLD